MPDLTNTAWRFKQNSYASTYEYAIEAQTGTNQGPNYATFNIDNTFSTRLTTNFGTTFELFYGNWVAYGNGEGWTIGNPYSAFQRYSRDTSLNPGWWNETLYPYSYLMIYGGTDATNYNLYNFLSQVATQVSTCTVTYNLQGHGGENFTKIAAQGGVAYKPTDPTESGWTFIGWYKESACTNEWVFGCSNYGGEVVDTVNSNTTIYAKWVVAGHDITYDMQGHGTQIPPQTVADGQAGTPPTAPTESGYVFGGWYNESACTTAYDWSTILTTDKTLYAKWTAQYTVNFDVQGKGTAPSSQTILDGGLVTEPSPTPTTTAYLFNGWFKESACTNEWVFAVDTVTQNRTLYAKWVPATYTITYNLDGGTAVNPSTYTTETPTFTLNDATKGELFQFDGWTGTDLTEITPVVTIAQGSIGNREYTAHYTILIPTYTVTFQMNGHGTQVEAQTVIENQTATQPTNPSESGWSFIGWYSDSGLATLFDFNTPITQNTTIYAKWTAIPQYMVTFNLRGHGAAIPSQTVYSGQTATRPTNPVAVGYTFVDWYNESSCTTAFSFSTAITSNKTLYAKWTKNQVVYANQIDWTRSMKQTYEFYKVDAATWKDEYQIHDVESCTINRDLSTDTLGSATFECMEVLEECYVRVYMIATQDGVDYKICLGTFLVQTPSIKFDGKRTSISMDGYTPLIELKNSLPPIGYTIRKWDQSTNNFAIMNIAFDLCLEHMRAPVVPVSVPTPIDDRNKLYAHFMANPDDTWFSYLSEYIAQAKYSFLLEPEGRVLFNPITSISALQPVWTYTDDNSSILLPEVTDERDLYGVPNVVEVVYSTDTKSLMARVENNDPNSPVSIQNRGREVVYRDTDPGISDNMGSNAAQQYLEAYAETLLKKLSTLEHTVTYSHGYCPVRIGDGVMLNYKAAGLNNVKAEVISQSFDCKAGCTVEETAMYTTSLLGDNIDTKRKIKYISLYGTTPKDKTVGTSYNLTSADLPALSAAGHTWGGWYKDGKYTTAASVADPVDKNLTLFAKWT